MKNALLAFILLAVGPLAARPAAAASAHPSLWHIKGARGEVYLLGAVHVLPPDLQWHTPAIARALAKSDTFVFEVPQDEAAVAQLRGLIQSRGFLPPGQTLRQQLHAAALPDYDAAVAASGLSPDAVEHERPWLAGIQMMFAQMAKLKFAAGNGVDTVLMAQAAKDHKAVRYFETIADQFALLAPADSTLELQEFESSLKDLRDIEDGIQPMVDAWSAGDQRQLDQLINGDLDQFPEARKTLLDDRNARWLPQIQSMLGEPHVFFITVGAGHLAGTQGVPALLRKAGVKVEGP